MWLWPKRSPWKPTQRMAMSNLAGVIGDIGEPVSTGQSIRCIQLRITYCHEAPIHGQLWFLQHVLNKSDLNANGALRTGCVLGLFGDVDSDEDGVWDSQMVSTLKRVTTSWQESAPIKGDLQPADADGDGICDTHLWGRPRLRVRHCADWWAMLVCGEFAQMNLLKRR